MAVAGQQERAGEPSHPRTQHRYPHRPRPPVLLVVWPSFRTHCVHTSLSHLRFSRVANIKSQIKRIRTNEAARLRNKAVKSSLKTSIRKFREAADAGDREAALTALQTASRQLDKAASKGVIHANQAANKKSAMSQRANAL